MFQWRSRRWGPALLRTQGTGRLGMAAESKDTSSPGHCGCGTAVKQRTKSSRARLGGGEMNLRTQEAPNNRELWGSRGGLCGSKIFVFVSCFLRLGLFLNWWEFKRVKASKGQEEVRGREALNITERERRLSAVFPQRKAGAPKLS